jgi:hypothetical protein
LIIQSLAASRSLLERIGLMLLITIALILMLVISITGLPAADATSTIRYAKPIASGSHDCTSWVNACTLKTALDGSISGNQVWVAQGIHKSSSTLTTTSFVLKSGVQVYGGFTGVETLLTQRDWIAYPTILSGDIEGNDTTDYRGVVTQTAYLIGNNSTHVVSTSNTLSDTVLDGFIITAGDATGPTAPFCTDGCGGGLFNIGGSPTLRNLIFSGNYANARGGGMYNQSYGDPALSNITFVNNAAGEGGGGLENDLGNPTLFNITFNGNAALFQGGGLENLEGNPTLTLVHFNGNSAISGGGMYNAILSQPILDAVIFIGNMAANGGGFYNENSSTSILSHTVFITNTANTSGGGLFNTDGNVALSNSVFYANTAPNGAGLANITGSISLLNSKLWGNAAGYRGGGVYNAASSNVSLVNVIASGNSALGYYGGGIYNAGNASMVNVTLSGNYASLFGGGLENYGSGAVANIANSIFFYDIADNAISEIVDAHGSATAITNSIVSGGYIGTNIIDTNPLFVSDPTSGDGDWTTLNDNDYGDLHLLNISPAIDQGDNAYIPIGITTDLDGLIRISHGTVDMGAYEFYFHLDVFLPIVRR